MKKHVVIFILLVLLSLFDSKAQITSVPDSNFEQALIDLDIDSDGKVDGSILTEDINNIISLNVSDRGIKDLTGIEGFEALETLNCSYNTLTTINLTKNLKLIDFNCTSNQLKILDVSNNTTLKYLLCSSNQITDLVVTNNPELYILDCSNNQLTSLDVSANTKLDNLSCSKNQLSTLNLATNESLSFLDASNNLLNTLNISNNVALKSLFLASNQLKEIDLTKNDSLTTLGIRRNLLTELLLSNNLALESLNVSKNLLNNLDLIGNESLTFINVSSNKLTALNIKNGFNDTIRTFDAQNNHMLRCIAIDETFAPNGGKDWLKDDFAYYNADCSNIIYAYVPDDNFEVFLETHDAHGNLVALGDTNSMGDGIIDNDFVLTEKIVNALSLNISGIGIKNLSGIETFITLTTLDCSGNSLSNLKLNSNLALESLNCASQIPYADPNDASKNYSFDDLDVSSNFNLTRLDCSDNNLSNLELHSNILLEELICFDNKLSSLNLSSNSELKEVNCSTNELSHLNLESNIELEILNCSYNSLEQLDLSKNIALMTMDCSNNSLYSLSIKNGNNTAIINFNAIDNNLICINVDDSDAADVATDWTKDVGAGYSDSCGLTYIADSNFEVYLETHDIEGNEVALDDANNMGDGIYNNLVLTSRIVMVDSLNISNFNIANLEGIEQFTVLEYLDCSDNDLTHLDVGKNTLLKRLKCQINNLEALDLSNNTELDTLLCNNNALKKLSIKNGENELLEKFDASSNSNLYCIEVDDVGFANAASGWTKEVIAAYNMDCSQRETYIPDSNFEQALIDLGYDTGVPNAMVLTANIEGILDLDIGEQNIYDLTGIEDFRSLDSLQVYSNYLSSLDLSHNINLFKLNCGDNQITDFNNLRLNSTLVELICDSNYFTEIDLSLNTAITKLDVSSNNLTDIDLSQNVILSELYCGNNFITDLNISSNVLLDQLNCADNLISDLPLDTFTGLKMLDCSNNEMETLDISSNNNIEELNCNSNQITELQYDSLVDYASFKKLSMEDNEIENIDVSSFGALTRLSMSSNNLETLNTGSNALLETLNISNNKFETINLSGNPTLKWLDCSNNKFFSLDVSQNKELIELICDNNQLSTLSVGNNINLKLLSCFSNDLETLNLDANTLVEDLNIRDNLISEIITENLVKLKVFNSSSNQIAELDLSLNSKLEDLNCSANKLWSLNIKNSNNGILESMNATNNPNLLCIQIDNINNRNEDWKKDEVASYSDNCHYFETKVPDDAFEQALIDLGLDSGELDDYVNTAAINTETELNVLDKGIKDLTGIEDFIALKVLNISGNQIASVDLSNNRDLTELYAANNTLNSIDLNNNVAIGILDVSNNELSELITDNLSDLTSFTCKNNLLVDLDLSSNGKLTHLNCASNQLLTLNIRNANNSMLSELNVLNNPDLYCIQADAIVPPTGVTWQKDNTATYSMNCHYYQTYVPDDAFEKALDPNGVMDDYVSTQFLNGITNLNVSTKKILVLTGLEAMINLKSFSCQNNIISSLDLSNNLLLENLYCHGNKIESIDLSMLDSLKILNISNNQLSDIDVAFNKALTNINVSNNELTNLDCSFNLNLKTIDCSENQLYSLDIKNGFNDKLTSLNATNNPDLTCILVDNIEASINKTDWKKDVQARFKLFCNDDDNDGVPNEEDLCPFTVFGQTVDLFGCPYLILPVNNLTILTTGETCISSNNGKINISAVQIYNYTATITGNGYSNAYDFTNSVEIRNLLAGTYELCITIKSFSSYNSCYDIVISEPKPLAVLTSKNTKNKSVSLNMSGSSNYNIELNGFKFNTADSTLDLSLRKGLNTIKISTDIACQGFYEEQIFVTDGIYVYPNPFEDTLVIYLGGTEGDRSDIHIYSCLGQLVYSKFLAKPQDDIIIDTSNLAKGLYVVSVRIAESLSTFKIVKK